MAETEGERQLRGSREWDRVEGTGRGGGDLGPIYVHLAIKNVTPKRHILDSFLLENCSIIILSMNRHVCVAQPESSQAVP